MQVGGAGRISKPRKAAVQEGVVPARSLHQAMSRGAGGSNPQLILHLLRQLILHTAAGRQAGRQRQAEAGRGRPVCTLENAR